MALVYLFISVTVTHLVLFLHRRDNYCYCVTFNSHNRVLHLSILQIHIDNIHIYILQ